MKQRLHFLKRLSVLFVFFGLMVEPGVGWGQVNISAGNTITEAFAIGTTTTATMPTGWKVDKNTTVRLVGSYASAVTATEIRGGNSLASNATNGIYNFGAGAEASATDRAVGGLSSGTASKSVNVYVQLTNNGATNIENFTISYNVEKYRNGSNTAGFSIQMYYSTNGTTWSSAGSDFLTSFSADADNNGYASAPGATVSVTNKTLIQSLDASSSIYLAWNYSVTSGTTTSNAQALGIDDVVITANAFAGNSITTDVVLTPPFCVTASTGAAGTVAYTSSGSFSGIFTAQLSDASGDFTSPTSIGTGDSPINITIPAVTTSGTGYKIRVVNSDPVTTGNESAAFEVINGVMNVSGASASTGNASSVLSWTNPSGCYDEIMIVGKASSAVGAEPSGDGSAYSFSLAFGSGSVFDGGNVLYKGTSSPQTVTGLTNGTTYHFTIFTRNGENWSSGTTISRKAGLLPVIWTFEPLMGTNENPTANAGNGTATGIGSMSGSGTATGINTVTGCGLQITGQIAWQIGSANPGAINESSGVQFMTSTVDESNIIFQFEQRWSGTSTNTIRIQYTSNGTDWTNFEMNEINTSYCSGELNNGRFEANTTADLFRRIVVDLSDISSVNNNPNFGVRVVASHYRNTGEFRQVASTGSVATSGTWRFDNVQVFSKRFYYSKNSGTLDATATWGLNSDGSGDAPIIITDGGQVFNITNRSTESISTALGSIRNLNINSGVTLEIASNGSLTSLGTLTNSGTLTLKSGAGGTGSLIHSNSGVSATVERYVVGHANVAADGWHLLGSPVATFNILGSSFVPGVKDDLYAWEEATNTWLNYVIGNPTQIVPGNGYLVAYENTAPKTFNGTLNVSDIPVSGLAHNAAQGKGWHLLGNPFASALEWNKTGGSWALTNIAGTAKIWNSGTKAYVDVVANGIIPSAQGFFVQVNESTTGSLTIPAAARAHSSTAWYKNSTPCLLLSASPTDGSSRQESMIRIESKATSGFDFYFDSRFMAGYAPQFYSIVGSEKLSTNSMPEINTELSIPFGFVKNQATNFSIELSETIEGKTIYLTDLKTNTVHKLSENPIYSFTSAEGDDPNRFLLHFGLVSVGEQLPAETLQAYAYNNRLYVNSSLEKARLLVYDLQGRLLLQKQINESGLQSVEMKMPAGVYIVRMQNAQQSKSVKIVVQ